MRSKNILSRIAATLTLFAALAVFDASAAGNMVYIHMANGQQLVYTHENHPMVIFKGGNNVTVKSDHKEISTFSLETLHKITFKDPAGLADAIVDSKGKIINIGPADFALVGFEVDTPVNVVSLGGVVMQQTTVDDSSVFVISLDGYVKGVYMITVGSESYKVALK